VTQNIASDLQGIDPGLRLADVSSLSAGVAKLSAINTYDAVVASTTQTQAGGTIIRHGITNVSSANASDAVTLPRATPGVLLMIVNSSGQTIQLFPFKGDKINVAAIDAAVTVATATVSYYVCSAALQWWGGAVTNEA
jgi:hypothetical protein